MLESWYIIAECLDPEGPCKRLEFDGQFPFDDDPPSELVECIVGSRPASADDDGGVEDAGRPLFAKDHPSGDFQEEHCAEECFPSWR